MTMSRKFCLAGLVVAALGSNAFAQSSWVNLDVNVDAYEPHSPYGNNTELSWTVAAPACATDMRVLLGAVDIEPWYDWLLLGGRHYVDGRRSSYTSPAIPGNMLSMRFHSDRSVTGAGYEIVAFQYRGCPEEPSFCAVARCAASTTCSDEERRCIPSCDGFVCDAGQTCELQPIVCVTTPCDPYPICVPQELTDVEFEGAGNVSIPDNRASGVSQTVVASGLGSGTYLVNVSLDIRHTWRGDLLVKLMSPNGQTQTLHSRTGGSADNLIFDDVSVGGFAGEDFNGTWTLVVSDTARADVGTLRSWSLHLSRPIR